MSEAKKARSERSERRAEEGLKIGRKSFGYAQDKK